MTTGRALRPGDELAGYRVDACVGRGGMGEVFRAHDERLGRDVAIKLLAPHRADDPAFRDRLLRESRLAASLDHPNVVPVYDAGEVDGRLYLVMRYVDGTDLRGAPAAGGRPRARPRPRDRGRRRRGPRRRPRARASCTAT